jgi:GNAT superfamily N-acetyltransferase
MIRRHADELALTGLPWPFRPALNMMAEMCEDGRGVWLVARDGEGTMIGYALFLLGPGMFLRDTLVSTCVALYVDPEWRVRGLRPVGLRFLQFCESEMRGRGAGLLEIAAMEGSALAGFLPKLAYVPAQTVLWKNLEETP